MLGAPAVVAQGTRVDIDNDAFNFWETPALRPDREYSQGIRITAAWPTSAGFARRLLGGTGRCENGRRRDCLSLTANIAQEIFTPTLDVRRRLLGERPYAGWLAAGMAIQRERLTGITTLGVDIGLTGKPSMAESAQKAVHRLFNFRTPQGWETQIPTHAGLVLRAAGSQLLARSSAPGGFSMAVAPAWEVRAGNVHVDASASLLATAGLHAPAPWDAPGSTAARRWGAYVRGGATQQAVGYNLFLQGGTVQNGVAIARNVFVSETVAGVGIVMPGGTIEWRVHSRSREYRQQPKPHTYSTIAFVLR